MKDPYRAEDEVLPLMLSREPFISQWKVWCRDRRDRKKPLTPQAAKIQLSRLLDLALAQGVELTCDYIELAINQGWQGLFVPDETTIARLKRQRRETNPAKNGHQALALERKRSEQKLWDLWRQLEITDEERENVLANLGRCKTIDDVRKAMSQLGDK